MVSKALFKVPLKLPRTIEEGLRRNQYFAKKNLTGDYSMILVKANTEV